MRITAPSAAILLTFLFTAAPAATARAAAKPDTPYIRISKLASYLSDGDAVGALEAFDKNMKDYGAIAEDIQALVTQTDVLCSIDVVADKEADNDLTDIHHLDLDWYMTLTSKADSARTEKRRLRVAVTIQLFKTAWRITSLAPEQILAPITIK